MLCNAGAAVVLAALAALSLSSPIAQGAVAGERWRWSALGGRHGRCISSSTQPVGASLRTRLRGGSDVQAADLRFKVGDRILARTADGWRPGAVVRLFYKEPDWPEEHKPAPYQIELDSGHFIYAQVDIDDLVRAPPDSLTLEELALHLAQARAQVTSRVNKKIKK